MPIAAFGLIRRRADPTAPHGNRIGRRKGGSFPETACVQKPDLRLGGPRKRSEDTRRRGSAGPRERYRAIVVAARLNFISKFCIVLLISGMDGTAAMLRFVTLSRTELWIFCRLIELCVRSRNRDHARPIRMPAGKCSSAYAADLMPRS